MDEQRWQPGLIGMAVHTDCIYLAEVQDEGGGSPELNRLRLLYQGVDFARFAARVRDQDWAGAETQMVQAARALAAGGADFLVITSGTGSTFAGAVTAASGLPVLDPVDVVCAEMKALGGRRAGLISTRRTDEAGGFHRAAREAGLEVLSADEAVKDRVQQAIFEDLIRGRRSERAVEIAVEAGEAFAARGADSLILGCTDFSLIATEIQARCPVRVIDVARLHARAARQVALSGALGGLSSPGSS